MTHAALAYAKAGWPVFPTHAMRGGGCSCGRADCGSPGKHPSTDHGLKDATTHPEVVRAWWRVKPWANIGIATGWLYVVDLDGRDGACEWDDLELEYGAAPTLVCRTGGGGYHRYYRAPCELGNTAHKIAPRIDTRGVGGYVLGPPSNHKSGHRYVWSNRRPVAPLPGWVISLVRPRRDPAPKAPPRLRCEGTSRYGEAVLMAALGRINTAQEGARNDTLNREAFLIGQFIAGGEIAPQGVADALAAACQGPDRKKNAETVRRGLRDGAGYPRSAPERED